jgi:hypothetical protein
LKIDDYLKSRALVGPWRIEGCTEGGFCGVVVIPALAESATLFATLCSLATNPPELCKRFLVLIVVNHRDDAPDSDKHDNLATLKRLAAGDSRLSQLNLAWIDAASPCLEMPLKGGGVGLARRIGLDLALTRLAPLSADPILVCLDADTLVRSDYLSALTRHFEQSSCGAAVIPFRHQQGLSTQSDRAIMRYELFLRCYVLGLSLAASPYAFHSVGSAMACRASAYMKIGGMNNRSAGEDFYFLQQLARTVGVEQLSGTVVFPSQRASHRVPFGTGRSISRILAEGVGEVLFYQTTCFKILGEWLALVSSRHDTDNNELLLTAAGISPELAEYLDLIKFRDIWPKLRKNNPEPKALLSAFHGWFDGLKSMKLIHHLSAGPFPRCEPEISVPELLQWSGLEAVTTLEDQLELLHQLQCNDELEAITQSG